VWVSRLLAADASGTAGGWSELNADGTPLQLCLTLSGGTAKTRLLGDPGWFLADAGARYGASAAALRDCFTAAGSASLIPQALELLASVVTASDLGLDVWWRGFIWLAAGLNTPGAALYVDMAPLGSFGAWRFASSWLSAMVPSMQDAESALARLSDIADLASLSLEGAGPRDARAKLYWRLRAPRPLEDLPIPCFADPALLGFLRDCVGMRPTRLSGMVMSAGFAIASGGFTDVKIDLCGHCVPRPAADWTGLLEQWAPQPCVDLSSATKALLDGACEVGNIGLGVDRDGRRRLNLYLKPPGLPAVRTRDDLRARLGRAIGHLIALRNPEGVWQDYDLPVGTATFWVTAFLGVALSEAAGVAERPDASEHARQAAAWLDRHRAAAAGWGYNAATGVDADTTGLVLRLHWSLCMEPKADDVACLLGHWQPGGGFATFHSPNHWADAHPCVTAVAFAGLPDRYRTPLLPRLRDYVRETMQPDGTWPAYWWRSHLYSTWHHLRLLRSPDLLDLLPANRKTAGVLEARNSFEHAYAAGTAYFRADAAATSRHLTALFEQQRVDGGWPGSANLRVTDPNCPRPWETPNGALYADRLGTITTASAIMVMTEMLRG
jgi:hypothetical protein